MLSMLSLETFTKFTPVSLIVAGSMVFVFPVAKASEAAKLIGEERSTSVNEGGFLLQKKKPRVGIASESESQAQDLIGTWLKTKSGHVFLLEVNSHRGLNGKIDRTLVLDAIDIPVGQTLSGSLESPCTSSNFSDDYILAVGKWNNKMSKSGYAGGYLRPITKAWRVDFEEQKLKQISTTGVKCEDVRSEANFD
jgi:hypothetical protein